MAEKTALGYNPEISGGPRETGVNLKDSSGEVVANVPYGQNGIKGFGETVYRYTDDKGNAAYTTDILKLPMKFSLDTESGNIKLSAPKEITETESFKQVFSQDTLTRLSQNYKLNQDYKVAVMETDPESGEKKERQITIEEYVARLNDDLKNYQSNLVSIRKARNNIRYKYGDKVDNLNESQMAMWLQKPTSGIYLPKTVFNVSSFGDPKLGNPLKSLIGKEGIDGSYSLDDFKEVFTRDNFGRTELMGLLAVIDGTLRESEWNTPESADEAAKLLALREYVVANHPEGEWYQQIGDSIESLAYNTSYYMNRVFLNAANIGQAALTAGQGQEVQNAIKDFDKTFEYYNTSSQLAIDAAQVMQFIGMIGGTLLGSWGVSKIVGAAASGIGGLTANGLGKVAGNLGLAVDELAKAANLSPGSAAAEALTVTSMASLASEAGTLSSGAQVFLKLLTAGEKAALATSVAKAFLDGHAGINWTVNLLADTIHDALLYDSTTLRDALESSDQETRDYWLGQLADNTKWWVGMAFAKGAMKFAGKTTLGKAADAVITPLVNKIAANWGERAFDLRNKMAGGSVVAKLETQLENAKVGTQKYNRIARKLEQEEWGEIIRSARRSLGDVDLDWDGMKLTDESLKKFQDLKTTVKALENGIDAYNRNIAVKMDEMVRAQLDPSTGKAIYINPVLAQANNNVSKFYNTLTDLGKKYNLTPAKNSLISQDMIDYLVGSYQLRIMNAFASSGSVNAAKAQNAAEVIQKNLSNLKQALPREIVATIDNGINSKIYQSWYKAQNEYGMAKGLLNRDKVSSYEANPIWARNGYMPVVVEFDAKGRFLEKTGRIDNVIEQDFEQLKYAVAEGQHYQDPELVRQSRLKNMARAEVNAQIFKGYSGFGSNATNITRLTGEQTEYVRKINENRKAVDTAISAEIPKQFGEGTVAVPGTKGRRPAKNEPISISTRETVTASMSPSQTAGFLVQKKVLPNKTAKLTDTVTDEATYKTWYDGQTDTVKKYIAQQAGEDIDPRVPVAKRTAYEWKKNPVYDAEYSESRAIDVVEGVSPLDEYIEEQRARMWESFKKSNQGTETFYHRDERGQIDGRNTVSYNGTLYRDLYNEYGGKPRKTDFNEAFDDVLEKGEDSKYYRGFKEFDHDTQYDLGYNAGNEDIDMILDVKAEAPAELVKNDIYRTNYATFSKLVADGGDDFEAGLQRAYLAGDEKFAKTSIMNEAARNLADGKEAFYQGVLLAKIKGEMRNALKIDVDPAVDSIFELVTEQVDNYVDRMRKTPGAKTAIETLAKTSNGADEMAKYIALRELAKKSNLDQAKAAMHKVIEPELKKINNLPMDQAELVYKKADEMLKSVVRTELDNAASTARTINPDLVGSKDIYSEAKALTAQIEGYDRAMNAPSGKNDYIMYLDDEGRQVYASVDPAFASLFNYRHSIETADAGAMAKINAVMSKAFRYGTTSVNLSSFGNQMFRDFGNALYVGGAFQTIQTNADNLVDVFGQDIVDQIKQFDPSGYEMRQVKAIAEQTGQTVEEAAVSRELAKGSAIAQSSTETTLYRKFMKEAYGDKTENQLTDMRNKLNSLAEKLNPDELLNGKRENYLRRRVYASALNDAMKGGYDLEQSRVFAEFAMNNATTNFSRQLYHLQAIADSTPYFRAAINGTKSFWRMWSLDPVGIAGRITGGLILPVMALTAYSLSSEENKKIYSNIPEYTKQSSLVFVFQGKPISIPLPQEMSNLVNPFRHFVEYLNVAQPNQFWELTMNDLLGFAPYDLQGFTAVDYDSMISDPTFFDRVSRGVSRVFSKMAPVPIKSAYMLATGIDPYSGKQLRSPQNNVIWNSETGETEVMDYNQNAFARWFADTFKETGISADLAEKVLSSLFGTTGSNLIGDMTALFSEGGESFVKSVATNIGTQISKPFTVAEYDLTNAIWKRAVNQLTLEKEGILNSKEFKKISSELAQTTDPLERQKLISAQNNMFHEFQQKVGDTAKRLVSEYGGVMDRQKYAAVMNLLNFNSDSIYQSGTQASSDIATQAYYEGRDAAIHTMWELGIQGTNDASIFGYLTKDRETGKTVVKYTSPIAIMDMEQQMYNQSNLNAANISTLLKTNNIKDAHNSVSKQIQSIYDKGKLTNQDRANIEAIQINWNAQLAKAIAPYVAQMTPEAAINNTDVLNLLYPYVEVPGDWGVNDKGRFVSLGSRGNKKKAYYESWIKSMFGVNDPYKGQY